MGSLSLLFLWFVGLGALAYFEVSLIISTLTVLAGLMMTTHFGVLPWYVITPLWAAAISSSLVLNVPKLRKRFITSHLFAFFRKSIPAMSQTEKQAIDSGTVGWESELFAGNPDWKSLLQAPQIVLTAEEQAFINGPVIQACEMTNDWEACEKLHDLPQNVWDFLKREGFFALIIPKRYGGKEFSALAHSEIIARLTGHSLLLGTTVTVPNSLGPAELLLHYGTEEQKDYYLPRLARGEEIPCFALTGPEAGSDAGAIPDTGIVCKQMLEGKEVLGIRLNWNKRYITLAPIATLLGLAFKLYDPERLLGGQEALGITCALIPTNTQGITIGRRHLPSNVPFQNGPTQGKDVFIPLDWIIGGRDMAGQGWRMLVECLSVGRAISLPSSSIGGAKMGVFATAAYSVIRQQFNTSLASFEGIQEVLGRMGSFLYMGDAARIMTVSSIDRGEKPSVPGAIIKYHTTEIARKISMDAMDIHAGKGIMQGPNNYLVKGFQSAPIGITVEGANILTRSLIIFGQGAIRCHPYILKEMTAGENSNFNAFDKLIGQHVGYILRNATRSFVYALTFSKAAVKPCHTPDAKYFQQLSRASAAFALVSDACMILLGGKLKFKESLSARLGDCLSMMYMGSSTLKFYADANRPEEEYPFVEWSMQWCLNQFWLSMDGILCNLPNPTVARALRVLVMPFGNTIKLPQDILNTKITHLLTSENEVSQRLFGTCYISEKESNPINMLRQAFQETLKVAPIRKRLLDAIKSKSIASGSMEKCIQAALKAKILTAEEATRLSHATAVSKKVIDVDEFDPKTLKEVVSPFNFSSL